MYQINTCIWIKFQEAVGDTLEELWISYNNIEKLKGINVLKRLKVFNILFRLEKIVHWVWCLVHVGVKLHHILVF